MLVVPAPKVVTPKALAVIVEFETRTVVMAPLAAPARRPYSVVPEPMPEELSSVSSIVVPEESVEARY